VERLVPAYRVIQIEYRNGKQRNSEAALITQSTEENSEAYN